MNVNRRAMWVWLLAGFAGAGPAYAQDAPAAPPDTLPGIAVLPFFSGGSLGAAPADMSAFEIGMQQILITELAVNSALNVVERSVLRELLAEQDLGASGRVDDRTAAALGKLVGARYVVKGGFTDVDGNLRIDGHIVEVATGKVIRGAEVTDRREKLHTMLVELAQRITRRLDLPALPAAQFESRRSRQLPLDAVEMYGNAQKLEDLGQHDQAIALYRQILGTYPQMAEADVALRKLTGAS